MVHDLKGIKANTAAVVGTDSAGRPHSGRGIQMRNESGTGRCWGGAGGALQRQSARGPRRCQQKRRRETRVKQFMSE